MKDWQMWLVAAVFTIAAGCVFAAMLHGCGVSPRGASYASELMACVHDASTREAADECTDAVAKRYGRDGRAAR